MIEDLENVGLVLPAHTQDNQARELLWWIGTNVSEICVQGDQSTSFLLANRGYIRIGRTPEMLFRHSGGIIASLSQRACYLNG